MRKQLSRFLPRSTPTIRWNQYCSFLAVLLEQGYDGPSKDENAGCNILGMLWVRKERNVPWEETSCRSGVECGDQFWSLSGAQRDDPNGRSDSSSRGGGGAVLLLPDHTGRGAHQGTDLVCMR